ncbi:uncharacterized protein B0H64DRAFT_190160 [Chaetomium fimeti]|jgi:hypothetical protein|uniref:Uncharacterized protein n=1 Tax=Chaetomium fimeti TaxID=1854472 RepID=A0AAE0HDI5_9PEZI|nr:hypothetical protein B0H64DRAFT_190160 [Chaetomium fimeti]
MQRSRPLGSLKDIFPRIHQPLPLNQRESQRLLETIKTSFRTQLDQEHGWISPGSSTVSRLTNSTPTQPKAAPAQPRHTRATDRHMHAVLNNPLFNNAAVAASKGSRKSLDAHKAIFEKAVSRGLVNLTTAHGFLIHINPVAPETSPSTANSSPRKPPPNIGAGLLVLQWLRSSGQERDFKFLSNRGFVRTLLPFLVAEGLDGVVWVWFKRLLKEHATTNTYTMARQLLRDFVAEKYSGGDVESAFAAVLKADTMVREMKVPVGILQISWNWLAYHATTQSTGHMKLPTHLYDPFVAVGRDLHAKSAPLVMALLNLQHPVDPSPSLAVELLSSQRSWREKDVPFVYILDLYQLGIDTVRHLIRTRNAEEASRLLDLLGRNMRLHANTKWLNCAADAIPA